MGDTRRSELLYKGPIEVAGSQIVAELRSNGRTFAVMGAHAKVHAHFINPTVTFADGFMTITGDVPGQTGATATWRIPRPEVFDFKLVDMTVRAAGKPDLKKATITRSQYRVRIEGPGGVDLSLPGARMEILQGKRAIVDGETIYMLDEKDCGCGTKK